eukprot:Clim_evm56s108 gene=Clim_evmTU56s108
MSEQKDSELEKLGDAVKSLIDQVFLVETAAKQPKSPEAAAMYLSEVFELMRNVEAANKSDVMIPVELLGAVDQDSNPDLFARALLESTIEQSENANGMSYSIHELKNTLEKYMSDIDPAEVQAFKERAGTSDKS